MNENKKKNIIVFLSILLILFISLSNRVIGTMLNKADNAEISSINYDNIYDGATQELDFYIGNYYVENDLLEQINFYGWVQFKDIKTELDDSTKIILKGEKNTYSISATDFDKQGIHGFGTRASLLKIREDIYNISLMLSNGEVYGIIDTDYYLNKEKGSIRFVKGIENVKENNDRLYELGTLLNFSKSAEYVGNKYGISGLAIAEKSGTWTYANVVDLFFEIEDKFDKDLILYMDYSICGESQRVRLLANGNEITNYVARSGECKEVVIPREYIENNELLLRFELPDACMPENGDQRELALFIKNMKISTEFSEMQ